jgi:hypothetical protein
MREKPGVVVHTCRASYVEVKQGNQTPCWPGQKASSTTQKETDK